MRCLVRDPARAKQLSDRGFELFDGDVQDAESLRRCRRGRRGRVLPRPRDGARRRGRLRGDGAPAPRSNFAEMAKREGVERVVYSRRARRPAPLEAPPQPTRTAEILREHGPPLTYFRAGMVVGARSESYRTLRYLVQRLPAMIAPPGSDPDTADRDRRRDRLPGRGRRTSCRREGMRGRRLAARTSSPTGRCSTGWLTRSARHPRRQVPVPLLTPWLSSLWIGLVTPVDAESRGP